MITSSAVAPFLNIIGSGEILFFYFELFFFSSLSDLASTGGWVLLILALSSFDYRLVDAFSDFLDLRITSWVAAAY